MTITVNGNKKEVGDVKSIQDVIGFFFKNNGGVIVQLNGELVRKVQWREQAVVEGDVIELIQFVGGG